MSSYIGHNALKKKKKIESIKEKIIKKIEILSPSVWVYYGYWKW